jgi:hypothetical protein
MNPNLVDYEELIKYLKDNLKDKVTRSDLGIMTTKWAGDNLNKAEFVKVIANVDEVISVLESVGLIEQIGTEDSTIGFVPIMLYKVNEI